MSLARCFCRYRVVVISLFGFSINDTDCRYLFGCTKHKIRRRCIDRRQQSPDGHLIDLAVSHCKKIFDDAPKVVVAPLFPKFSAAISRVTLDSTANIALWWLPPPSGYDTTIPEEPINIVQQFAERLYQRLSSA